MADLSRRKLLKRGGATLVLGALGSRAAAAAGPSGPDPTHLPKLLAPTENEPEAPPPPEAPGKRAGVAIVGLGHLALDEILPAFGQSRRCRPAALVSGDRAKATALAARH